MSKKPFTYNRLIRLAPSFGDWTTLTVNDHAMDEIQISPVHNINFDSLPRELLKVAHTLHYHMAERMVETLSKDMRIKIELHSIQASQLSYEDFLVMQEDKVVQTDFVLSDLGRVNVIFDWNLADAIVNRLVGGKGERDKKSKFTAIEGAGLQAQMEELVPSFVDQWKGVVPKEDISFRFSWGPYVQDKTISLREAYVLFTFNLYFGKESLKKMVIAYPNNLLRTVLSRYQTLNKSIVQKVVLNKKVQSGVKVPVSVSLGETQLSMADVKRLQTGDVLRLNRSLSEPVPIHLGDETILKGQMGVSTDQHYSLQIIFMDEDQNRSFPIQHDPVSKHESPIESADTSFEQIDQEDGLGTLEDNDLSGELETLDSSDATSVDEDFDKDTVEETDPVVIESEETDDNFLEDSSDVVMPANNDSVDQGAAEDDEDEEEDLSDLGEFDDEDLLEPAEPAEPVETPAPEEVSPSTADALPVQEPESETDQEDDEFSWDDLDV